MSIQDVLKLTLNCLWIPLRIDHFSYWCLIFQTFPIWFLSCKGLVRLLFHDKYYYFMSLNKCLKCTISIVCKVFFGFVYKSIHVRTFYNFRPFRSIIGIYIHINSFYLLPHTEIRHLHAQSPAFQIQFILHITTTFVHPRNVNSVMHRWNAYKVAHVGPNCTKITFSKIPPKLGFLII